MTRRVLLVSASAKPGGAERAFSALARALPAHGWEPVCVLLEDGPLREWLEPNVVVLPAGRTRQLARTARTVRALARIAREHDAAAVVSSLSKTHVYGGAAAALARIPAVQWQHGIPTRSRIELAAARVPAAAVVCVSGASAAAQRSLTPRREIAVVHPAVSAPAGDGAAVRAQLGWDDAFVAGIVGRLEPWKGQETFLRAAALVAETRDDARFAVVGGAVLGWEGDYPERLRALADELGLGDRVCFTGHRPDVGPWYDALDVVVHASTDEPFGLVLVEAMALGKPIVTVEEGGAAEIVEADRSALVVPARDAAALAAAIARIADDPELAARLSAGALARAREFTPERTAAEFAAVLDRATLASRTPSDVRVVQLGAGWFPSDPGGLSRYFRELHEELGDASAIVLGPAPDAPASVTAVSNVRAPLPSRLLAVRRAVRRSRFDVLDAHFALTAVAALTPSLRRKLVVHFQGPWADESAVHGERRLRVAIKRAVERAVYRRARRIVTLSDAFKDLVVARYGVDPARVDVIPPGVDLARFTPGDTTAARARLDLPRGAFVVAAARRLVPRTGVDVLLDAWHAVREERPDALLVVAGDGPDRAELQRRADSSVRFLGHVPDDVLVDLYRAADVTAVPSLALEGFGLSAAESLACGTPVVVTDVGGLPEVVRGLDDSLVVPPGDADALAQRLLGPLPPAPACCEHAERFSWATAAARHRALYGDAARLRVVSLDHTAALSGGELALLRTLPALDADVHVVLAQDGPLAGALRAHGVSVEVLPLAERTRALRRDQAAAHLPAQALATLRYSIRLARRLRELDADVVHTNSLKAAVYGGLAARIARVPAVWHVHDRIAPDYLPRRAVWLVRLAARLLPSAIVANSRETLQTLPRRRRSAVVPPPVETIAHHANGSGGPLRVGMIGRIAPWKGQHVFLEAFARAFGGGDEAAGRVVGAALFGSDEEAYARELHELAGKLGVANRIEFAGFREDVAAELANLDVLVHASVIPEPFGLVVAEGMAAGLPVVAANAGGPAELIEPDVNGVLYAPGDSAELATALRRLADDARLRRRLGDAARVRARSLTPERTAAQLLEVLRSVR